jgi:predicted membrane-bound spermidine synthase
MTRERFQFLLLLVSFIEGGSLMAFEILSSKLYTPYLGSSIYVWTSILTVTLIGLAVGYRIGGKYAEQDASKKLLQALAGAALLIGISSFIAKPILEAMLSMDVRMASLFGGMLIIFLPVLAMGMVSPLIVGLLTKHGTRLSMSSGLVYGIGTLGGIIFLLITAFIMIPLLGVKASTFVLGCLLIIAALIVFIVKEPEHEK